MTIEFKVEFLSALLRPDGFEEAKILEMVL
jgi:hypothetical protein